MSRGLLYIGSHINFIPPTHWPPTSTGLRSAGTCLKIPACAMQLGSGVAPCSSAVCCWQALFCLPLPLLILSFYFQPAFEYNTEEPCAEGHRHTPLGVLAHPHFISFCNKQDQRRKVGQTPLRCWAWLCVALNTDGPTQDNCCLLLMEGPSAMLCTLHLKTPHESQPKDTGEGKKSLSESTVRAHAFERERLYALVSACATWMPISCTVSIAIIFL